MNNLTFCVYRSLCIVLLALFSQVHATADIDIDWYYGMGESSRPSNEPLPGDTVTFTWSGFHDVKFMTGPAEDCDFSGSSLLGNSSPVVYTVPSDALPGSSINFGCSVGSHCTSGGMYFSTVVGGGTTDDLSAAPSAAPSFSTSEAPTSSAAPSAAPSFSTSEAPTSAPADIDIDWYYGMGESSRPSTKLLPGDTVTFTWIGFHDVKLMTGPAGDCDFSGSSSLGRSSPVVYTVPPDAKPGSSINFGCSIGSHCTSGGMYYTAVVGGGAGDGPGPTPSSGAGGRRALGKTAAVVTAVTVMVGAEW